MQCDEVPAGLPLTPTHGGGCAEKKVPGRSIDNLKSAAMNIKVRLAIQVANAERDVREMLDED
jgi:hypothetical protein